MLMVTHPASSTKAMPAIEANDCSSRIWSPWFEHTVSNVSAGPGPYIEFAEAGRRQQPFLFHDYVALGNALQPREQLAPADVAIVAQHRDSRYAAAFDDYIALRRVRNAAHVTHVVIKTTAPAERGIAECLEETQEAALNGGRRAGPSERGYILHRRLADAPRIIAGAAGEPRIEAHRAPVDEFERLHVGINAAGDLAEGKCARDKI